VESIKIGKFTRTFPRISPREIYQDFSQGNFPAFLPGKFSRIFPREIFQDFSLGNFLFFYFLFFKNSKRIISVS
jgi:hypothetical protein